MWSGIYLNFNSNNSFFHVIIGLTDKKKIIRERTHKFYNSEHIPTSENNKRITVYYRLICTRTFRKPKEHSKKAQYPILP